MCFKGVHIAHQERNVIERMGRNRNGILIFISKIQFGIKFDYKLMNYKELYFGQNLIDIGLKLKQR